MLIYAFYKAISDEASEDHVSQLKLMIFALMLINSIILLPSRPFFGKCIQVYDTLAHHTAAAATHPYKLFFSASVLTRRSQ